jgi:hypothetical protein
VIINQNVLVDPITPTPDTIVLYLFLFDTVCFLIQKGRKISKANNKISYFVKSLLAQTVPRADGSGSILETLIETVL